MLIGNPFSSAPNPGIPGNVHTPQPNIPGSVQDGTRSTSGVTPGEGENQLADDEELGADGKVTKKKKAAGTEDELGVDYEKLWDNETDPSKQVPNPDDEPYLPKVDPKKLAETVSKIDFKRSIKPEQLQAITAGGEGAAAAVADIVQDVARQVMLTSFSTANKLFESGIGNAVNRVDGKMSSRIQESLASNALSKSNLLAKNPTFAPVVEAFRAQIQKKYPKLNANQVETAVNSAFSNMIEQLNKKPGKTATEEEDENKKAIKQGAPTADWETWFTEELSKA